MPTLTRWFVCLSMLDLCPPRLAACQAGGPLIFR